MTRFSVEIDLIGSTETTTVDAPGTEAAHALVALMYPHARSVTVTGVVPAQVPAR